MQTAASSSSSSPSGVTAGIAVGIIALAVILLILILYRSNSQKKESADLAAVPMSLAAGVQEIDPRNIQTVSEIGSGEFGVVMKALAVGVPGSPPGLSLTVAVKLLKASDDESERSFRLEAERLGILSHNNVAKVLGVCFTARPLMIVMEHMSNGDLKVYLRGAAGTDPSHESIGTVHCIKLSHDVAKGVSYLQSQNYVHRDLAARNILLDDDFTAKIGDFGMARKMHASEVRAVMAYCARKCSHACISSHTVLSAVWPIQQQVVGTTHTVSIEFAPHNSTVNLNHRWMAPESFFDGVWDLRSDAWMFAVLLWGQCHP